ncbi:YbgA family protein [Fusibacter sp. JL216-2]|uniref:YbgA family protein n=1 Tax=Fusibacter sp. JL216-2 TaxID=3071453 RepID=UPI003D339ED5
MTKFEKPTVVISKCIEHDHCRYDGSMITSEVVKMLKPYVNFETVCPEMAIGLPSPREALRIVRLEDNKDRLVFSQSGAEKTEDMVAFSDTFLQGLNRPEIDGFILKHRSPSCGMNDVKIYKGPGKSNIIPGKTNGIFGSKVLEYYPNVPVENEGRMRNYNLREAFLIGIFAIRGFKTVKYSGSMKDLVKYHANNKYLFMALSPGHLKTLGKIVANHEKLDFEALTETYEETLIKLLLQPMDRGRNINAIFHVFGYFKEVLSSEEKAYFLECLEMYNKKKVPFSMLLGLLRSWSIRFNIEYLKDQTIFEPFPKELFDVTDSGKGL